MSNDFRYILIFSHYNFSHPRPPYYYNSFCNIVASAK